MFVFKFAISILLSVLVFALFYNLIDDRKLTVMETFVIICVVLILILAIVCIWI